MSDDSDRLDRFKEAFERGEQGQVNDYHQWLQERGFNPDRATDKDWVAEYFRENPEAAANHDEQIESAAEYIGFFSRKGGCRHLPVIGVSGIGKTLFLHTVRHAIAELSLDIPVEFVDADAFSEKTEDDRFKLRALEDRLMENDQTIVLVDNCDQDKEIIESLRSIGETSEDVLVLSAWSPEWWRHHYADVETALPVTDEVRLEEFSDRDMAAAVRTVFAALSDSKTTPDEGFIDEIVSWSQGVPRIAVALVYRSLEEAFRSDQGLDEEVVAAAAEKMGLDGLEEEVYGLPESRLRILTQILLDTDQRGTQPSHLVENLHKDKSTVSYHLRELRDAEIVESERSGRMAFYSIREPAKPIVQSRVIQQGEIYG
jgi:DNA-binding transcriptional ArsR family regulator